MKTSWILLLVVGLIALPACGDTASPETVIVSDSANATDSNASATASTQSTSTAQPVATSRPAPTKTPVPSATPTPEPPPTYTPSPTPTSKSYFDLGKESIANDDIDSAITNLSRAIELDPDNVDAYYLRGLTYSREEEFDKAIADFEKVAEFDPNHADVKAAHADVYRARGAYYGFTRDFDSALADFERAIELDPDNAGVKFVAARIHVMRGIAYFTEGDYGEAIADFDSAIASFERIIELDPDNAGATFGAATAYFIRGLSNYEEGFTDKMFTDLDRGLSAFERAIELEPDNADVKVTVANTYLSRAHVYFEEGEYDRAIADFERVIELDPDNAEAGVAIADAYLLRGVGYAEKGDQDRAIADFERVIEIDPDNTKAKKARKLMEPSLVSDELSAERIEWSLCKGILECGSVEVPADYRDLDAGTIKIAVNIRRAEHHDQRTGYLFVNPGGPGESGLELVRDSEFAFAYELLDRFDIVGFDPRGVGASEPEFACGVPDEQLALLNSIDGDIDTPEETATGEAAANLCIESMGPVGGLLHSEYVARDMDEIRKALGAEQISYLGFSYGSTLGVWYATLFPEAVRAMVVDGADNPVDKADTQQDRIDEAVEEWEGFEELLEQALEACDSEECPIYNEGDPIGYYESAVEKLHLVNSAAGDVPYAGFLAVLTTLYGQELWPALWQGLHELNENDDPAFLLELAAIQLGEDLTAPNFTSHVNCLDGLALHPELDRATRFEDSDLIDEAIAEKLPLIYAIYPSGHSACPFYDQFAPTPLDGPLDGGGVPILVVGNHTDPATPFAESEELVTDTLSNGYLLETSHASHVVYPDNNCVNEHVHRALIEAVYPGERVYCERED